MPKQPHSCNLPPQITFINEPSGEYQYYEATFKATRPGVISTIDLVTPVRQSVHHKIRLDNPLPQHVVFTATCNVQEVLMPSTLSVPPNSSVSTKDCTSVDFMGGKQ